jgi:hypothetical protein
MIVMQTRRIAGAILTAAIIAGCVAPPPAPSERPVAVASASAGATPMASVQPRASLAEPTGTDAGSADPSADAGPSPEPTVPTDPGPSLPPAPGWPRLAGVVSTWRGGCGGLFDGTVQVAGDDCGPTAFGGLLEMKPIRVLAGARLVLRPAEGSAFSAVTADLPGEWTVTLARATDVAAIDNGDIQRFPQDFGTILAHGRGPDVAVVITMPARAGDYVIQFDGPIVMNGWTFVEGDYYWLVRII